DLKGTPGASAPDHRSATQVSSAVRRGPCAMAGLKSGGYSVPLCGESSTSGAGAAAPAPSAGLMKRYDSGWVCDCMMSVAQLNPGFLGDTGVAIDRVDDRLLELLRGVADRRGTQLRQTFLDVITRKNLHCGGVQLLQNICRQPRRRDQAEPGRIVHFGQPHLFESGHIGHCGAAFRRS